MEPRHELHAVVRSVGAVSVLGRGADALWRAVQAGERPAQHDAAGLLAAHVADEHLVWPTDPQWKDLRKYSGRMATLAMTALDDALRGVPSPAPPESTVCLLAAEPDASEWWPLSQVLALPDDDRTMAERIHDELPDFHFLRGLQASGLQALTLRSGARNGSLVVSNPLCGGLSALALARRLIATQEASRVIVVGASPFPPAYEAVARRHLGVVGEGAAAIVLDAVAEPAPGDVVLDDARHEVSASRDEAARRLHDRVRAHGGVALSVGAGAADGAIDAVIGRVPQAEGLLACACAIHALTSGAVAARVGVLVVGDFESTGAAAALWRRTP